jgi:hypothetical protein
MKDRLRTSKTKRVAKLEADIAKHEQAIARSSGGNGIGLAKKDSQSKLNAQSKLQEISSLFDCACEHWADDSSGANGAAEEGDEAKDAAPARPQVSNQCVVFTSGFEHGPRTTEANVLRPPRQCDTMRCPARASKHGLFTPLLTVHSIHNR